MSKYDKALLLYLLDALLMSETYSRGFTGGFSGIGMSNHFIHALNSLNLKLVVTCVLCIVCYTGFDAGGDCGV